MGRSDFRMQAFADALTQRRPGKRPARSVAAALQRSDDRAAWRAGSQERVRRLRSLEDITRVKQSRSGDCWWRTCAHQTAPRSGAARPRAVTRSALSAWGWGPTRMKKEDEPCRYIDHHAHMVSRTTDDYQQMALTGCVAVTEPAFWAGWDRSGADGFEDYFRQLTEFEPARAAQYRIQHYTWMAMNPKEADDRELRARCWQRIPKFLDRPDGPRHRRNRPEPRHPQRDRDLHRAGRAGARAPADDPDSHAASGRQAERHADLGRRAQRLPDAASGNA